MPRKNVIALEKLIFESPIDVALVGINKIATLLSLPLLRILKLSGHI